MCTSGALAQNFACNSLYWMAVQLLMDLFLQPYGVKTI